MFIYRIVDFKSQLDARLEAPPSNVTVHLCGTCSNKANLDYLETLRTSRFEHERIVRSDNVEKFKLTYKPKIYETLLSNNSVNIIRWLIDAFWESKIYVSRIVLQFMLVRAILDDDCPTVLKILDHPDSEHSVTIYYPKFIVTLKVAADVLFCSPEMRDLLVNYPADPKRHARYSFSEWRKHPAMCPNDPLFVHKDVPHSECRRARIDKVAIVPFCFNYLEYTQQVRNMLCGRKLRKRQVNIRLSDIYGAYHYDESDFLQFWTELQSICDKLSVQVNWDTYLAYGTTCESLDADERDILKIFFHVGYHPLVYNWSNPSDEMYKRLDCMLAFIAGMDHAYASGKNPNSRCKYIYTYNRFRSHHGLVFAAAIFKLLRKHSKSARVYKLLFSSTFNNVHSPHYATESTL